MFYLAWIWSHLYGFAKDRFGMNLPGLGFALRRVRRDRIISIKGRKLHFNHKVAAAYGRPIAGDWNEPETHFLLNFMIPRFPGEMSFVDVGASIGEMVVDVSRHANVARIIAFEPIAECCRSLRESLDLNGYREYRVIEKLVGAEHGSRSFAVAKNPAGSSIVDAASEASSIEVPMTTLNDEVSELRGPVIMLIDVEGYEPDVLRGGAQWISAERPLIIFEYNTISKRRYSICQIRELLGPEYSIYRLRQDGRLDCDVEHAWNCVAIHQESPFMPVVRPIVFSAGGPTDAPPHLSH